MAAVAAVFASIGQEIVKNLFEPCLVAIDINWFRGDRNLKVLTVRRATCVRKRRDRSEQRLEVHGFSTKLNLSLGDARDVQEVVDHAAHILDLPLKDELRPLRSARPAFGAFKISAAFLSGASGLRSS
jgi:hypothetical protein